MAVQINKAMFELADGTVMYWHTSGDVVYFDNTDATKVLTDCDTVQEALVALDNAVSDRVGMVKFTATIGTKFEGTEAPYTQTINVEGIRESDEPIVGLIVSTDNPTLGAEQEKSFGRISRIVTGTGYITVYCNKKKPEVELNIRLMVFREV